MTITANLSEDVESATWEMDSDPVIGAPIPSLWGDLCTKTPFTWYVLGVKLMSGFWALDCPIKKGPITISSQWDGHVPPYWYPILPCSTFIKFKTDTGKELLCVKQLVYPRSSVGGYVRVAVMLAGVVGVLLGVVIVCCRCCWWFSASQQKINQPPLL